MGCSTGGQALVEKTDKPPLAKVLAKIRVSLDIYTRKSNGAKLSLRLARGLKPGGWPRRFATPSRPPALLRISLAGGNVQHSQLGSWVP